MEIIGFRDTSPARLILQYIQRQGQATIKELEDVLGVSTTAVREHLSHLYANGLVTSHSVRHGPGRPRLVYTLTDKAQALFPKQYELLINLLLQEIAVQEGTHRVEQLLERVGARLAEEYTERISEEDIKVRLDELRTMLETRGIAAELQPSGEGIKILSCPFLDVAQEHGEVCAMEQQMIEQVLGEEVTLDNSIRDGHYHCCFNLVQKRNTNGNS
jgi:predicted ArsR family transcriptional regulator